MPSTTAQTFTLPSDDTWQGGVDAIAAAVRACFRTIPRTEMTPLEWLHREDRDLDHLGRSKKAQQALSDWERTQRERLAKSVMDAITKRAVPKGPPPPTVEAGHTDDITCVACGETKPPSKFPTKKLRKPKNAPPDWTLKDAPKEREARCRACRDAKAPAA